MGKKVLEIHPVNPQPRLMKRVEETLRRGGLVIFPTDAGYSVGCLATEKKAIQRLYKLKAHEDRYHMVLMVENFSSLANYAEVESPAYRFMKSRVPGHYTFILPAEKQIRKLLDVKRPEIGVRIPDHPFFKSLHDMVKEPILSTAARIDDVEHMVEPIEIADRMGHLVDMIVDMGPVPFEPTTVISLLNHGEPEVIREGSGIIDF